MMKESQLRLTHKQAMYCVGYCKMTNVDDSNDHQKTDRIQFVELLEMIGRIAKIKFYGTDIEDEPLHLKIERVLDLILPMVNCQRRELKKKIESDSESDADY